MCKTRYPQNRVLCFFLKVKLDISTIEFHLNFQKNLSDKICVEVDIANIEFHL